MPECVFVCIHLSGRCYSGVWGILIACLSLEEYDSDAPQTLHGRFALINPNEDVLPIYTNPKHERMTASCITAPVKGAMTVSKPGVLIKKLLQRKRTKSDETLQWDTGQSKTIGQLQILHTSRVNLTIFFNISKDIQTFFFVMKYLYLCWLIYQVNFVLLIFRKYQSCLNININVVEFNIKFHHILYFILCYIWKYQPWPAAWLVQTI